MKTDNSDKRHSLSDSSTWIESYGDYLYRYAFTRVRDASTSEDLVQETFLSALDAKKHFKGRSSEKTWLTGILKHKLIDHFRKKTKEQSYDNLTEPTSAIDVFFDKKGRWKSGPSNWEIHPDVVFERKEFWHYLHTCISKLSKKLADTFILKEIEGLSTDEICKVLNISTTNCWVLLHRARFFLRDCLEKTGVETHR